MSDPHISLVDHFGTVIASNDDWQSAFNSSEISLSNQSPSDPREPAILVTLSEGTYTIVLNSKDGGGGNVVLELINLYRQNKERLSRSVRGEVDSVEPMIHSLGLEGSNEMSLLSLLRGRTRLHRLVSLMDYLILGKVYLLVIQLGSGPCSPKMVTGTPILNPFFLRNTRESIARTERFGDDQLLIRG